MARPSKKAERTEEILQAFQQCVARYGLEGSTLEHIAQASGLQRSLVRHYVGNREALVEKLADRVIEQSVDQWRGFLAMLPATDMADALIEGLFEVEHSDAAFVLVIESLIFSAGHNPALQKRMQHWMHTFSEDLFKLFQRDYPQVDEAALRAVSFGIISLYFNLDSLSPLGMSTQYRPSAQEAAKRLVASLHRT
ncbi:TetR/AcrR family transcriptional regulator [Magnetococcus sp. PR-3]|uniref:TetR/AcrR family transcriptional regulator n=1 Tax=Magnetococcus sp. PR-3 TaxID=3120355 RepID=UPI002FCDE42B